ncbi:unnamed protein product, partial [Closterium sp. NIES-65]
MACSDPEDDLINRTSYTLLSRATLLLRAPPSSKSSSLLSVLVHSFCFAPPRRPLSFESTQNSLPLQFSPALLPIHLPLSFESTQNSLPLQFSPALLPIHLPLSFL